jgi:hypothetical protein
VTAHDLSVIARSPKGDEAIQERWPLDCFASAIALRASADLKPAVARTASEGGSLAMTSHAGPVATGKSTPPPHSDHEPS